jgi:hypothetical protein
LIVAAEEEVAIGELERTQSGKRMLGREVLHRYAGGD